MNKFPFDIPMNVIKNAEHLLVIKYGPKVMWETYSDLDPKIWKEFINLIIRSI